MTKCQTQLTLIMTVPLVLTYTLDILQYRGLVKTRIYSWFLGLIFKITDDGHPLVNLLSLNRSEPFLTFLPFPMTVTITVIALSELAYGEFCLIFNNKHFLNVLKILSLLFICRPLESQTSF